MIITCKYCGKETEHFPCHKSKFCNKDCYAKWKVGDKNNNWKGGKHLSGFGYYYIRAPKNHPNKNSSGYIFEHRIIMENHIGRYLKQTEIVHHINGVKTDNRIENLIVVTKSKHNTIHLRNKQSHKKGIPRNPSTYKRDPNNGRYIK